MKDPIPLIQSVSHACATEPEGSDRHGVWSQARKVLRLTWDSGQRGFGSYKFLFQPGPSI
jgi:hypothetical protein